MKKFIPFALLCLFPLAAAAAQPWQEITMSTVAQAAESFANPPREYSAIHWAIWGGQITKQRILNDIENLNVSGGGIYMINNSGSLEPVYLTPEYMDLVKYTVDECKKRGMKVWIEGDAGYPDGFAGGLISKDYPQLGMQGIVADCRYTVAGGQTLSIPLPTDTLGIVANNRGAASVAPVAEAGKAIPIPSDGKLKWTGPSGGTWDVTIHAPSGEGHYSVVAGQTLAITIPPDTQSIEAGARTGGRGGRGARGGGAAQPPAIIPVPADGKFTWTAPGTGTWEVTFVRHVYRSSPTRFSDRADGSRDKDSLYSLIDYLDPEATATYIKVIHEAYAKVVGDEFGKTILGFRCDETDFTGFMPWTPKLLETFQQEKGYGLQPYIASFFANPLTPEAQRVKADYWDVWSGMFRNNFYKPLEDWCEARGMRYSMHLNHINNMVNQAGGEDNVTNEGSFWRDMRYIGVPGTDNLVGMAPGLVLDFPKLPASAAHLFGRPLVWDEQGGDTSRAGKYVIDYQLVRGINHGNIRGLTNAPVKTGGEGQPLVDQTSATGWYVTRSEHLLALGRPAPQVALYHPTDSYWLRDGEADTTTLRLQQELMEHQIDFDHIDPDSLASVCTLEDGGIKNLSGNVYRAVIIPTSTVIQKAVLERLRAFAAGGGKVIFVGRTPTLTVDRTFLHADTTAPDLSFATLEPTPDITDKVVAALPRPDVKLDSPCRPIVYLRRSLKDGDVYFFFNESAETQTRTATLAGTGTVQVWDAQSGTIHPLAGVSIAAGSAAVPMVLAGHEARIIVIGPLPANAAAPVASVVGAQTLAALDGNWAATFGGRQLTTGLKSWQDLGVEPFNGTAVYHKDFTAPANLPQGERAYLDLGTVADVAEIRVNGKALEAHNWAPFVWDVTDSIKSGDNTLEVLVQVPAAGGGRGGGGGGGRAARGGGGGANGGVAATNPAGGRGAGRGRGGGRGAAAGGAAAPEQSAGSGLLGPVRLIAQ